jgi:hypothetical protein
VGRPADPTQGGGAVPEGGSFEVGGDPLASLDVLRRVTERIGEFLGRIG